MNSKWKIQFKHWVFYFCSKWRREENMLFYGRKEVSKNDSIYSIIGRFAGIGNYGFVYRCGGRHSPVCGVR